MYKPKNYFSVNQQKCLKEPILQYFTYLTVLQPLVEPDQSSMVYQLSLINQTLCTWASEGFIPGGAVVDFPGEAKDFSRGTKMVKFYFPSRN